MAKKRKITVNTPSGTFTRTTARSYSHIVVARWDEDRARARAYGYTATDYDRQNFDYYSHQVALGVEGLKREHAARWGYHKADSEFQGEYDLALEKVAGGFEGYVARRRQDCIDHFESELARGGFKPFVFAWCGRLDLASNQATAAHRKGLLDVTVYPVD